MGGARGSPPRWPWVFFLFGHNLALLYFFRPVTRTHLNPPLTPFHCRIAFCRLATTRKRKNRCLSIFLVAWIEDPRVMLSGILFVQSGIRDMIDTGLLRLRYVTRAGRQSIC